MLKRPFISFVFFCLAIFSLAACGSNTGNGSGSTPTATATSTPVPTPSPTQVAFNVTSIDLVVNPDSIAGKVCGSSASFTYTTTFHIPANTAGGTIQFQYTLNNGHSSTNASVAVSPGETTKTYSFSNSGTLYPDHTYPGIAEVLVNSPNRISSPQVKPAGTCTTAAFSVTSIDMAVNPTSIAGKTCGTAIIVTYTATFHIAANTPGGTIQFTYTVNNGRSSPGASVTVAPGQTTATYSFTWSGNLPSDHTYPGLGGVITSSPNVVHSPLVQPTGMCS
ncbi:MAG TPA: hypothetical protein VNW73_00065 [Ktedonobacteraceae bacterium]|nr:hypothetical protein [Ktedonobacteraceae bacterium]